MHIIALFLHSFLSFNWHETEDHASSSTNLSATSAAISSPIDPHEANPSHTYPSAAANYFPKNPSATTSPLLPTPLQSTSLQPTPFLQSPLQPTLLFIQPIPLLSTTL